MSAQFTRMWNKLQECCTIPEHYSDKVNSLVEEAVTGFAGNPVSFVSGVAEVPDASKLAALPEAAIDAAGHGRGATEPLSLSSDEDGDANSKIQPQSVVPSSRLRMSAYVEVLPPLPSDRAKHADEGASAAVPVPVPPPRLLKQPKISLAVPRSSLIASMNAKAAEIAPAIASHYSAASGGKVTVTITLPMHLQCQFTSVELLAVEVASTSQSTALVPAVLNQAAKVASALAGIHHAHESSDDILGCSMCRNKYLCIHTEPLGRCQACLQTVAASLARAYDSVFKPHRDMQAQLHAKLSSRYLLAGIEAAKVYLEMSELSYRGTLRLNTVKALYTALCSSSNPIELRTSSPAGRGDLWDSKTTVTMSGTVQFRDDASLSASTRVRVWVHDSRSILAFPHLYSAWLVAGS